MTAEPGRDREHRRDQGTGCARCLHRTVVPRGPDAERGLDRGHAALGVAALGRGRGVRRQAVDVFHREPGVVDRVPYRFDRERQRRHHEFAPDPRHADAGNRNVVLELLRARHRAHRSDPIQFVSFVRQRHRGLAGRFEERDPYVVDRFEDNPNRHADVDGIGLAPDDVRRQADARILVDGDDGHDERRRVVGRPLLNVRGVALHDPATRHGLLVEVVAAAARQIGAGGCCNPSHDAQCWNWSNPSAPAVQ